MKQEINQHIAQIFTAKADRLEAKGERYVYRALAYRKAARTLQQLPEGVDVIYQRGWLKGLEKIEGVGNRLAHDIENELKKLNRIKK